MSQGSLNKKWFLDQNVCSVARAHTRHADTSLHWSLTLCETMRRSIGILVIHIRFIVIGGSGVEICKTCGLKSTLHRQLMTAPILLSSSLWSFLVRHDVLECRFHFHYLDSLYINGYCYFDFHFHKNNVPTYLLFDAFAWEISKTICKTIKFFSKS